MALAGRPSSQFYVFAENEDLNPWEPFHVSQGFKREDSCVIISSVMSAPGNPFGGGAVEAWMPQQILDSITRTLLNSRTMMAGWKRGGPNPGPMKHILIFEPQFAMELDRLGHTPASLQKYLYDRATIPYEQLTPAETASIQPRIDSGEIPTDRVSVFKEALKPGGKLPISIEEAIEGRIAALEPRGGAARSFDRIPMPGKGFEELRTHAASLGADAVIDAEFEHGEGSCHVRKNRPHRADREVADPDLEIHLVRKSARSVGLSN